MAWPRRHSSTEIPCGYAALYRISRSFSPIPTRPRSFSWILRAFFGRVWWLPPSLSTRTATHIHTAPRNWHVPYVTNHLTTKHAKIKTPTKTTPTPTTTTPTTTNENWEHTLHGSAHCAPLLFVTIISYSTTQYIFSQ